MRYLPKNERSIVQEKELSNGQQDLSGWCSGAVLWHSDPSAITASALALPTLQIHTKAHTEEDVLKLRLYQA